MSDLSKLRSLDDLAAARTRLEKQAEQQERALKSDAAEVQRELNFVVGRFRRFGQVVSTVASFVSPLSSAAPKLSRGFLIASLAKRIFKRLFKK